MEKSNAYRYSRNETICIATMLFEYSIVAVLKVDVVVAEQILLGRLGSLSIRQNRHLRPQLVGHWMLEDMIGLVFCGTHLFPRCSIVLESKRRHVIIL